MSGKSAPPTTQQISVWSVLAEGVQIAVVFGFWVLLVVPLEAYQQLFTPQGVFGAALTGIESFILFVGVGNVLLYVLVRANELDR